MSGVDVLIVTAIKMEFDAAYQVALSQRLRSHGIPAWEEKDTNTTTPYLMGDYVVADGSSIKVALTRPTRMGGTSTAAIVASLVERLHPRCLAMCGVCAGNPADLALGDVVIAEMVYAYDEGKRSFELFEPDHRQIPMSEAWVRSAQELVPDGLPSFGAASEEDSNFWLLERLYCGDGPKKHPARERYFPKGTWATRVRALESNGLVCRSVLEIQLTENGRNFVESSLAYNVDPPERLPFAIKVGPMASGNVVVKDGVTWNYLKNLGVRSILGLEMEAATIGSIAHRLSVPQWVVVKGVMDHADLAKDDRYKPFAARASAEVLMKFLGMQLTKPASIRVEPLPSKPSTKIDYQEYLAWVQEQVGHDTIPEHAIAYLRRTLISEFKRSFVTSLTSTKTAYSRLVERHKNAGILHNDLGLRLDLNGVLFSDTAHWRALTLKDHKPEISVSCMASDPAVYAALKLVGEKLSKIGTELCIYFTDRTGSEQIESISKWNHCFDFILVVDSAYSFRKHEFNEKLREYVGRIPVFGSEQIRLARNNKIDRVTRVFGQVYSSSHEEILFEQSIRSICAELIDQSDVEGCIKNLEHNEIIIVWPSIAGPAQKQYGLVEISNEFETSVSLLAHERWLRNDLNEKRKSFYSLFIAEWNSCAKDIDGTMKVILKDEVYMKYFIKSSLVNI